MCIRRFCGPSNHLGLLEPEADFVSVEAGIQRHGQGAPDSLVTFMGDDGPLRGLPLFGKFFLQISLSFEKAKLDGDRF